MLKRRILKKRYRHTLDEATYHNDIHINCRDTYNLNYIESILSDYFKEEISSSVLNYIDNNAMNFEDLDEELDCLIDNFIIKNALHMVYAKAGTGKTFLSVGIALKLLKEKKVKKVIYIDMDNSVPTLKSRGLQQIVKKYDNFKLITRNKGEIKAPELLKNLADDCKKHKNIYSGYFFVFDSIRDFLGTRDMNSDKDIIPLMDMLKNIRDSGGATILFLHHTSKSSDGGEYKGSTSWMDSSDEGFSLTSTRTKSGLYFELEAYKKRLPITNMAFDLNTDGDEMELIVENYQKKNMKQVELVVVEKAQEILINNPDGLSQSGLLKKMGRGAKDGSYIKYLQSYVNIYWKSIQYPEQNNKIVYYPLSDKERESYES